MYKLSLAHIYPKLLNFYGDAGNVVTLQKRCQWRGIELSIIPIELGEKIPDNLDMYFIGGGLPNLQIIAAKELILQKENLTNAANNNAIILAISEGYQLLGEYIQYKNQEKITGLNILDVYSEEKKEKFVGNVTSKCNFLSTKEIVGFENHTMQTFLEKETEPLFEIVIGKGNNNSNKFEGAKKNNVFGTYLHGPLLPKNPHFADYLINLALERKYSKKIELEKLNDKIEISTHKNLVGKKY